jgi:hypothetical protein
MNIPQEQILRLIRRGWPAKRIAAELQVSAAAIRKAASRAGLRLPRCKEPTVTARGTTPTTTWYHEPTGRPQQVSQKNCSEPIDR